MRYFQWMTTFACTIGIMFVGELRAGNPVASQLLPESTVGYVEVSDAAAMMAYVYDHPLSQHIQNMDAWQKATQTQQYRAFLTGRKFFEIQIGSDWRTALEALTDGGIYAAFDAATQGAVALICTKDEETAENFRVKILELTRVNAAANGKDDSYRDINVYRMNQQFAAAVVKNWIVVTNKDELGKTILDRLLDRQESRSETEVAGTLSANTQFNTTHATRKADSQVWAYGNLQAIRESGAANKLFEDRAENPLVELLAGGIQSILQMAPFLTADLALADSGLSLQLAMPCRNDWIPEERIYYFGSDSKGTAPLLPEISNTLATLTTYRDVSQMWLRAGDLFDEQMNDKLAEADSGLSTIFAGRDFGEEILGALQPQMGLIVTRQRYENIKPVPAIKLPAFALILKLRNAEDMRPELRRTFQSVIGFFNIVGAMAGRPQLEMDMLKVGNVDLITSHYVPAKKDKDSTSADIIFNFSPSAGFSGDQFILASSMDLAKELSNAPAPHAAESGINTQLELHSEAIRDTLIDNREQLISQNMLAEGHSREEAEAAIGLLFEAVRCIKQAGITLRHENDSLALQVKIVVNENP